MIIAVHPSRLEIHGRIGKFLYLSVQPALSEHPKERVSTFRAFVADDAGQICAETG